ncbi:MAG: nitroreductase [Porticoccaceae bacterium]
MQGKELIDLLRKRVSCGQLGAPGTSQEQLDLIFEAAFRAADHRNLKPWRFLVVEGDGLDKLGEAFLASQEAVAGPLSEDLRQRALALPRRAPTIIIAAAHIQDDPKVPEIEQLLSTGAAVQNMLNAAHALGLGAMWRTGELAFNRHLAQTLGFADNEKIVAFLYLGTPKTVPAVPSPPPQKNHVRRWP